MKHLVYLKYFLFGLLCLGALLSRAAIITSTNVGGNWSVTATWVGNKVPGSTDQAIIATGATVIVDGSVTVVDVTVNNSTTNGATLSISSGKSLTVSGTLMLSDGRNNSKRTVLTNSGTINVVNLATGTKYITLTNNASGVIKLTGNGTWSATTSSTLTQNGSFIVISNATGTGSFICNTAIPITVQRYVKAWTSPTSGWHFISSPVAAQAIQPLFVPNPPTANEDFYKYDEVNDYWVNSKTTSGGWNGSFESNFVVGRGYLCAWAAEGTKVFQGNLNVSNVTFSALTNSSTNPFYRGWNLIGNPYPCALTWNPAGNTWNLVNMDANAQIWDEAGASYTIIYPGKVIPAMNGFMVHVKAVGTGSLVIPTSSRLHDGSPWYKETESDRLTLRAVDPANSTWQESIIRFRPEASEGFDSDYDSWFLQGYAPVFASSFGDGTYLALNTLPTGTGSATVSMAFVKNSGTDFTIEASGIETFQPNTTIILEDKKTGTNQDLTVNPVYAFTSEAGDDPERFAVHISGPLDTGNMAQANPFKVYSLGPDLFVNAPDGSGTFEVVVNDMLGRTLLTQKAEYGSRIRLQVDVPAGIYLVNIYTQDARYTNKVFLGQ